MKTDQITIEVLADGTLKVTTDKVSAANHVNAEKFIREMFSKAGGEVEIKHKHGKTIHHHKASDIQSLEAGAGTHKH